MKRILVLLPALMVLAGCSNEQGSAGFTFSAQPAQHLVSMVVTRSGVPTFQCKASNSGQCHYRIYPQDCTKVETDGHSRCTGPALQSFVVQVGQELAKQDLPEGFQVCASSAQDAACL